jgi:hypothetical protein
MAVPASPAIDPLQDDSALACQLDLAAHPELRQNNAGWERQHRSKVLIYRGIQGEKP